MTDLIPAALFGWPVVALLLFSLLPGQRAVLIVIFAGWMFLPVAAYNLPGLPPYSKLIATNISALLGSILLDASAWRGLRLRWPDLFMVGWALCPLLPAVLIKADVYDGLSATLEQSLQWLIPYVLGRVYFRDPGSLRVFSLAMVIAGLVYMPFCLWEARMSPRLHLILYGMRQHNMFSQAKRFEGWRPMVFMQHGLAVGLFMATSAAAALWLAFTRGWKGMWGMPAWAFALILAFTTILCKSLAALGLLCMGVGSLWWAARRRGLLSVLVLASIPGIYVTARISGVWDGSQMVQAAAKISETAEQSIRTRVESENAFLHRFVDHPLVGHGRSGWKVLDERGRMRAIPDGLWIITAMRLGMTGVVALYGFLLVPPVLAIRWTGAVGGASAWGGGIAVVGVCVLMFAVDCLLNAMVSPIFPLASGALVSVTALRRRYAAPAPASVPRTPRPSNPAWKAAT